ncbi:hypothetical protein SG34_028505 [Thalassomonas viridans]|uniref:Flagellar protein FliT n=1 Tax=Thalassomonas viridans TaxID=137584 RepID=A0AAF0C9F8_9GAMM|nr:hypothetical protein [Thalassomonas viridans]WDE05190.1 hypothetical protein SG34_028505 [Thalassomonas viridans]
MKKNITLLTRAMVIAADDFQINRVAELDQKVTKLLSQLIDKPELRNALKTELNALYQSHQRLLQDCRLGRDAIRQSLKYLQQNKEGLLAYQEMDEQ